MQHTSNNSSFLPKLCTKFHTEGRLCGSCPSLIILYSRLIYVVKIDRISPFKDECTLDVYVCVCKFYGYGNLG